MPRIYCTVGNLVLRQGLTAAVLSLATVGLGCAAYEPIEPIDAIRDGYAERLGTERARSVAVPFELSDEIRSEVDGRVNFAAGEARRTEEVLSFVFDWLGLEYAIRPTRDAVGTFKAREGNCLSFVNLFVGLAREFRLNPFYVEVKDYQRWNYRDGVVVSRGHMVAGMYVDGELSTFDFLPYRPKGYRDFDPVDDLTATAHYYNNLGAEALMEDDLGTAAELLELAVDLAPDFDKALNNLGVCYLRQGRTADAIGLYRKGLALEPDNVPLLSNLARAYQQVGNGDGALELLTRIEALGATSPYFYVYRGEVALARGDTAEALEYMRRAMKRDSEVPEVHLGLLKVYLALGDLGRAQHHLERALRLDATNVEARHYAAMLSGGASESESR